MTLSVLEPEAGRIMASSAVTAASGTRNNAIYFTSGSVSQPTLNQLVGAFTVHKKLAFTGSSLDENPHPMCLVWMAQTERAFAASSSRNTAAVAADYYDRIENQLSMLASAGPDDQEVEEGAVQSALNVVNQLRSKSYAPPSLSWHGGDAVVMLWALGDTTYAITVTDGELGYVVRRAKKAVKKVDSIMIDSLRLEDLR